MTETSVLIVGGGVFGTSTAYHLAQRGYKNVTVVDRFDAPSKDSAGTDLNKVIRADYPNPLYAKLGMETMRVWESPRSIFSGLYRKTGWIMGAHAMTRGWLKSAQDTARKANRGGVEYMTAQDMRNKWPALTGEFPDWTNLYSPDAGWVSFIKRVVWWHAMLIVLSRSRLAKLCCVWHKQQSRWGSSTSQGMLDRSSSCGMMQMGHVEGPLLQMVRFTPPTRLSLLREPVSQLW